MFGVFVDHYPHSCMFKAKTSVQANSCWATCPIFVNMNDQLLHLVPLMFFFSTHLSSAQPPFGGLLYGVILSFIYFG